MRKWILRFLLCILFIVGSWLGYVYKCAYNSKQYNVLIETTKQSIYGISYSIGSGVIISDNGWILTARHCIENTIRIKVTLPNGQIFDNVTTVFISSYHDVALIKLPFETKHYSLLSDSNNIEPRNIIYNIGNASGIWDDSIFLGLVYKNHFKRLFLGETSEFIFARMYAVPGCSGGGVYHYKDLIGIVVMGNDGITFIVPSNICKRFYEEIKHQVEIRNSNP